jgi:hypothetical protein
MPPRYAYWTILVDEQPTAFRAALQDDLMPTFKRLREKHPSTRLVWFQNGKVWNSRLDAQEAMRERGERGRAGDERQGGFRSTRGPRVTRVHAPKSSRPQDPKTSRPQDPRTPRPQDPKTPRPQDPRTPAGKLEWKPKGEADPKPARKLDWQPKGKLEWSPRGKAAGYTRTSKPQGPRTSRPQDPKTSRPQGPKTSRPQGPRTPRPQDPKTSDKRDKRWRPGGEHRDPRQKYKDAKKAKWTRFKQTIRTRWEKKQKKDDE